MGYYTDFTLHLEPGSHIKSVSAFLEVSSGYDFYQKNNTTLTPNQVKWYSYADDMKALSEAFPEIFFTLYGEGEEPGDRWVMYAINGQTEDFAAEVAYPKTTLRKPEKVFTEVKIPVAGVEVPITVYHLVDLDESELYKMAKEELKKLLS